MSSAQNTININFKTAHFRSELKFDRFNITNICRCMVRCMVCCVHCNYMQKWHLSQSNIAWTLRQASLMHHNVPYTPCNVESIYMIKYSITWAIHVMMTNSHYHHHHQYHQCYHQQHHHTKTCRNLLNMIAGVGQWSHAATNQFSEWRHS